MYEEEITKEKQVALLFESNLPELYLDIDVLKFESILGNLLSNAFKYTSEGEMCIRDRAGNDMDRYG